MIRRPPRSTLDRSSAASDVYKRQNLIFDKLGNIYSTTATGGTNEVHKYDENYKFVKTLSLIHISEPTRPY